MTEASGKYLSVGIRYVNVFQLNAAGYPAASSTTFYKGLQIVGGKAFDVTIPDSRRIPHTGDDTLLNQDRLPPNEPVSATLTASRNDHDVYTLLTGTKVEIIGGSSMVGIGTDRQGHEPQVGLMCYQQALDETGKRVWRSFVFPRAIIDPKPGGMNETAIEHKFPVFPQVVTKHLWGTAYTMAKNGFLSTQYEEHVTEYEPALVAAVGDGTKLEFLFDVDKQAISTDKIVVYVDGVEQTTGVTKALTGITFTAAPAINTNIVVWYEF